ncbi:MAG: radical SAM protein [Thermoleophilia bacterium]|nr:radical SAM protein [Thermoleophilia bacterium]
MAGRRHVLSAEVPESLRPGWEIGRRHFGRRVYFHAPSIRRYSTSEFRQDSACSFPAVSITGSSCRLMCDHCRAHVLKWMKPAVTPEALTAEAARFMRQGARGLLVSGGSDADGAVPLAGFLEAIREVRERFGLRVIVHTGITGRSLARGMAAAGVDAALIDIIGCGRTISDVCHLPQATMADYERSLANLNDAGVPASPHVVIGLDRGRIRGELQALEIISRHDIASLVMVGLLPMKDTPMRDVMPPSPEQMAEIFMAARELVPDKPIQLGCERPAGEHRLLTDQLALKAGLNGIAYPAEGIIGLARKMGLEPEFSGMCCALGFCPEDKDPEGQSPDPAVTSAGKRGGDAVKGSG